MEETIIFTEDYKVKAEFGPEYKEGDVKTMNIKSARHFKRKGVARDYVKTEVSVDAQPSKPKRKYTRKVDKPAKLDELPSSDNRQRPFIDSGASEPDSGTESNSDK